LRACQFGIRLNFENFFRIIEKNAAKF
jgi:hypothetical protein